MRPTFKASVVAHKDAALLPLALNVLPAAQAQATRLHLRECARCINLAAQIKDELALLALALPPISPSALLREGLCHALGEVSRLSRHLEALMELLALPRLQAERLLFALDEPSRWRPAQLLGAEVWPLGGPRAPCFLRLRPGQAVLSPRLQGVDQAYLLQGRCRDAQGRVYAPGSSLRLEVRGEPHFVVLAGVKLICLLKAQPNAVHPARPAAAPEAAAKGTAEATPEEAMADPRRQGVPQGGSAQARASSSSGGAVAVTLMAQLSAKMTMVPPSAACAVRPSPKTK